MNTSHSQSLCQAGFGVSLSHFLLFWHKNNDFLAKTIILKVMNAQFPGQIKDKHPLGDLIKYR